MPPHTRTGLIKEGVARTPVSTHAQVGRCARWHSSACLAIQVSSPCCQHPLRACSHSHRTCEHSSMTHSDAVPRRRMPGLSHVKPTHSEVKAQDALPLQRHSCQHVPCCDGLRVSTVPCL